MPAIYETELPISWTEAELQEAAVLRRGYTWEKEQETEVPSAGTTPVLRIPNVKQTLDLSDMLYLRDVPSDALEQAAVSKNWILFVGSNGNPSRIGDSVLLEEDQKMVFASFLLGLTSRQPDELLPEFLALWMKVHNVHETFSRTSQKTTGLANYSWSAVKKLPIRYPTSTREQGEIIQAVTAADEAIQKTKAELEATRRLKKALMQHLFTRGMPGRHDAFEETKWVTYPKTWDFYFLKEVASVGSGFTMGRDLSRSDTLEVPYVTVVNVLDGEIDISALSRVEIRVSELESGTLQYGDILITEGGDRDKVGRGGMWRDSVENCAFQNHIFRVKLDPSQYLPALFHYLIQSNQPKRYFFSHAKQTSNLNTINGRDVKMLPVAIPEIEEQKEMLALLESADESINSVKAELAALEQLKKSLLQNLLTGKVRVSMDA